MTQEIRKDQETNEQNANESDKKNRERKEMIMKYSNTKRDTFKKNKGINR